MNLTERVSLYTIQHYESKPENLEYIDVTDQYERILDYIDCYKEVFGEWNAADHKETLMKYFGQFSHVKYAEAVKKLVWKSANKYLT